MGGFYGYDYEYFFSEADKITETYQPHPHGSLPESYSRSSIPEALTKGPSSRGVGEESRYRSGGSHSGWDESPLQDVEDRFNDMAIPEFFGGNRGANNRGIPHEVGDGDDIDLDNMTYEEINELEESTGKESKGLSEELMSMLPSHKYIQSLTKGSKSSEKPECLICLNEYTRGDVITTLPCTHQYHETCIKNWLRESKSCCLCKTEVTL